MENTTRTKFSACPSDKRRIQDLNNELCNTLKTNSSTHFNNVVDNVSIYAEDEAQCFVNSIVYHNELYLLVQVSPRFDHKPVSRQVISPESPLLLYSGLHVYVTLSW